MRAITREKAYASVRSRLTGRWLAGELMVVRIISRFFSKIYRSYSLFARARLALARETKPKGIEPSLITHARTPAEPGQGVGPGAAGVLSGRLTAEDFEPSSSRLCGASKLSAALQVVKYLLHHLSEWTHVKVTHGIDHLGVNIEIVVSEYVTHAHHSLPLDLWVSRQ